MTRKLHAWVLIAAFAFTSLPWLGGLAGCGPAHSCCSSASCCQSGHCSMGGPNSTMPANCPMGPMSKHSQPGHCSVSCACSLSPAPSMALTPVHTYLYLDLSDHSVVPENIAPSPLHLLAVAISLPGHPHPADHPPRFVL